MIKVISYKDISKHSDLFFSQFQLRHREFIDRQGYAVRSFEGMEFDQYDTLASIYIVYSEDGKNVLGCSRLTPVDFGCMLADHFPHLVDDPSIFAADGVWEGTRFCIDRRLAPNVRRFICAQMAAAYVEFGLAQGISRIIGLMPTLILRSVFERNGIWLDRLGEPFSVGEHSRIQAASIRILPEQRDRIFEQTGIINVLEQGPDAHAA